MAERGWFKAKSRNSWPYSSSTGRVGCSSFSRPSWQGTGPSLTSELMLSALGFTRMMVSRISLWWQRVLWPERKMQGFVLKRVGID